MENPLSWNYSSGDLWDHRISSDLDAELENVRFDNTNHSEQMYYAYDEW